MKNIMLDLETMGNGHRAAIASIGAVAFEPRTGELGAEYYVVCDLTDAEKLGFTFTGSTISWWLQQPAAAREALISDLMNPPVPITYVLARFAEWIQKQSKEPLIWGNGVLFDNRIIRDAFELVGLKVPWSHRGDRDVRTLVQLARESGFEKRQFEATSDLVADGGTEVLHNALHDARRQARYCSKIYQALMAGRS